MPSKRHSRKSHSRKRRHSKSRAYGRRRRRSMYGGDKHVYWVEAWQGDKSALDKLVLLGYVFEGTEEWYPNQYMTTSQFVDIIDKHFAKVLSVLGSMVC